MEQISREEMKQKMNQKDMFEEEMAALSEYLQSQGVPGLHGGLVDSEGFPRADVDIHRIRTTRQRLACLNTDHQALMKVIEAGLLQHVGGSGPVAPNSSRGPSKTQATPGSGTAGNAGNTLVLAPAESTIAHITEVTAGSPAELAQFQMGDMVLSFGSAVHPATLSDIAAIVRSSVAQPVSVQVRREGAVKRLTLVPRQWAGQGLIGMRLVPV